MHKTSKITALAAAAALTLGMATASAAAADPPIPGSALALQIQGDPDLDTVLSMAEQLVTRSFDTPTGEGYPQVWVRDLNTYLPLYFDAGGDRVEAQAVLMRLLALQEADGSIPDGYDLAAQAPFKNTVEADQETSLVQAFHTYLTRSGDWGLLDVPVVFHGRWSTVRERLEAAMEWIRTARTDESHGLVWNGATVDWGDIEAGNPAVVTFGPHSHPALGIYTNAMYATALKEISTWPGVDQQKWANRYDWHTSNVSRFLWDWDKHRYRAHVYLAGSPFPASFDETQVNVHGGTAVAIQAGLLTQAEILEQVRQQEADVKAAGAQTVGLTVWPLYPPASFTYPASMCEFCYQNGGEWDWFGGRMVQGLVPADTDAAYRLLKPMLTRIIAAGDFWEYWDHDGAGQHSSGFKGAAGAVGSAIVQLQAWAAAHRA